MTLAQPTGTPHSHLCQLRSIDLSEENLDAVGCFLEYLYTGEYFPQKVIGQRGLVNDPSMPDLDQTGEQLLKHARVYTLADKFGIDALKALAHSKSKPAGIETYLRDSL
jgi:hypothetical protein